MLAQSARPTHRLPGGEYTELHASPRVAPAPGGYAPLQLRPNARGRITFRSRIRVALSRILFRDRIAPVTGSIGTVQGRDAA